MEAASSIRTRAPSLRQVRRMLVVAVGCALLTWFCTLHPVSDGVVFPAWLPSGLALGALLRWGESMSVAFALGALAAALLVIDLPLAAASLFAIGHAVEVLLAARILTRIAGGASPSSSRAVLGLVTAAPIAAAFSASTTTAALLDTVAAPIDELWLRYLLGDMIGILVLAPFILAWTDRRYHPRRNRSALEVAVAVVLVLAAAALPLVVESMHFVELLLVLPPLSWAAVRFGPRGAASGLLAVAVSWGQATRMGTEIQGLGISATIDAMQVILAIAAASNLVIASILTERYAALVRVREVIDTFNHSQRVSRSGSWEYRLDGRERVWCSDELCRILLVTPDADHCVSPGTLGASMPAPERARLDRAVRDARLTGRPFRLEQRVPGTDGSERILLHIGELVPPLDETQVERLVGSLLDITEERGMENFKDDLIATASHELRTPLTAIVGFADTLTSRWETVPETQRRSFVSIIDQQAHRLERIVADTLLQSQVDARSVNPDRRAFLIGRSVRNVIAAVPEADRFELELEPGLMAVGDPAQFERVVENLVTNALKYGRPPMAVRTAMHDRRWVEMRVEDHGGGVPLSFRSRLFDRFARGPDVGTAPGTGLGLSIARGLVEAAGGTISYQRWHGTTTFVVRMPAAGHPRR